MAVNEWRCPEVLHQSRGEAFKYARDHLNYGGEELKDRLDNLQSGGERFKCGREHFIYGRLQVKNAGEDCKYG